MNRTWVTKTVPLLFALMGVPLVALESTRADVPRVIAYQGRLIDAAGDPLPGPVTLSIRFYDAPTLGIQLGGYEETLNIPAPEIINGVFSVLIGAKNPVPDAVLDAAGVWLAVSTDGFVTEFTPRPLLATVPYAAKARSAEQLVIPDTFTPAVTVNSSGEVTVGRIVAPARHFVRRRTVCRDAVGAAGAAQLDEHVERVAPGKA